MKLEELGERGLIARIVRSFQVDPALVSEGAGEDDCAVIDLASVKNGYRYLLVTTDTLQESTHFPRGMTPFQKGWSAVAVNLSDIAAMGLCHRTGHSCGDRGVLYRRPRRGN
jgi:thiamine-monophosphate kinase